MKRFLLCLFSFAVLCSLQALLGTFQSSYAQENEVSRLQGQVTQLESRVKELEALLQECQEAKKTAQLEQFGWQNKKNWRKLSKGMQEGQVKSMLGEPSKVIQGVKTLWYYPNIYCGYVSFDEKGRVIGWNEP
jgi:outer membrane protein assembly factor BamE (lipoprotein component of BamABCDE complex)